MKLIVIDLDRIKYKKPNRKASVRLKAMQDFTDKCTKSAFDSLLKNLNENKVCTLTAKDFGKKTLMSLPKGDPACLIAHRDYEDAIFKLKDDDDALKFEDRMFRKLLKEKKIQWFRVGMILKRDKAVKILSKLLKIS